MSWKDFFFILFIAVVFSAASNCTIAEGAEKMRNIRIEGTIIDNSTNEGISEMVKVEVLRPDSTLLATTTVSGYYNRYTQTIETDFRVTANTDLQKLILKLSSPDYKTLYLPLRANKSIIELGRVAMRPLSNYEKVHNLQELTVTASVVQFVNKGDTISYNANAFALAEGSMLDALVEQLPGVEIRENGQIFVNGRFVEKLMLDGKDFFKGNQLVLLQNLPAYTIKNIKVYEEAQTMSKVLGKQVQNPTEKDPLVMDVVLKKGYNTSWILNAEGGREPVTDTAPVHSPPDSPEPSGSVPMVLPTISTRPEIREETATGHQHPPKTDSPQQKRVVWTISSPLLATDST